MGDSSSAIVAPPKAPARVPTKVMPIWIVERNSLGVFARSKAVFALLFPSSAICCSLDLREDTTAISDIAKMPLAIISKIIIKDSIITVDLLDFLTLICYKQSFNSMPKFAY
jgi:hypothetical protein